MNRERHVVVLGAGYAGLMAAMRLAKNTPGGVAVTLVSAADAFQERMRNHQLLARQPIPQRPLSSFLSGTRIRFVHGTVTALEPLVRRVTVETADRPQAIGYDYLIYALGSVVAADLVPGVREHAYTLDHGPAVALAARLPELAARGGRVLIVGGGNTGVEVSTELAEVYPGLRITLLTRRSFAAQLSAGARTHVRRAFTRLGIRFLEHATVTELREHEAVTAHGESVPYDVCVWVAGFGLPDVPRRAGVPVNARGQILVDRALRSISYPEIYAAGDAAWPMEEPGAPMRMGAGTAVAMGAHAADSLAARLAGRTPMAFGFSYAALGISLGRRDGVVQFLGAGTDRPTRVILTGKLAGRLREFFVRLIVAAIMGQRYAPWTFSWPGRRKMHKVAVPALTAAARSMPA